KLIPIVMGLSAHSVLQLIFYENIGNAVEFLTAKFSPEDYVKAEVRIRAVVQGGELWLQVIDNGPGFPPDELSAIGTVENPVKERAARWFRRTERGHHLYATQQLADRLRWRLILENREDNGEISGASVSIVIPLEQ